MEINNFKKGNYLEYRKGHHGMIKFYAKVNELKENVVICINKNGETIEEEFVPIELNSDIMIKIGFKKRGETYTKNIDGYFIQWIDLPQFTKLLTISHQGKDDFMHKHNISYLHELQNAFYIMTNQEMNILL